MNRKLFYEAVIILLFLAIGIQPSLAINIPDDKSVGTWDGSTYTLTTNVSEGLVIVQGNLTLDGNGHTLTGTSPPSGIGVSIVSKIDVTVQNLEVSGFHDGIYISSDISLPPSSLITLENNNIHYNVNGIQVSASKDCVVTSNTVSNNNIGILIHGSGSTGNTVSNNSVSGNVDGIKLYYSSGSNLTNNTVSNNTWIGILLEWSHDNTLEYNTAMDNIGANGFHLSNSNNNTVRYNTSSNNTETNSGGCGIVLNNCGGNKIYNNNFIANTTQAKVVGGSGNVFNLSEAEGGGNYWSDYMGVDENFDGFGDTPYTFTGGQDDLPIFTPKLAITQLIDMVEGINAKEGIINSLDVKLQNALDALDAANAGLRQDAINKMEAFINAVEAQSGNQIEVADANALIAFAEYIIGML